MRLAFHEEKQPSQIGDANKTMSYFNASITNR